MIFFVYLALLEHEGSSDIINTNERIAKSVSQCALRVCFTSLCLRSVYHSMIYSSHKNFYQFQIYIQILQRKVKDKKNIQDQRHHLDHKIMMFTNPKYFAIFERKKSSP